MPREVDLLGKKFTKLTVLRKLGASRGGSILWECQCECGNIITASTRHLNRKNNTVKSCGCLKLKKGKEHKDFKGYEGISGRWWSIHLTRNFQQKSRKKIKVEISIKYAWDLLVSQNFKCALSGVLICVANIQGTASIDRIDSNGHYSEGNIQWVHKDINFMKRIYSQEYFIEMCKKVAETHK